MNCLSYCTYYWYNYPYTYHICLLVFYNLEASFVLILYAIIYLSGSTISEWSVNCPINGLRWCFIALSKLVIILCEPFIHQYNKIDLRNKSATAINFIVRYINFLSCKFIQIKDLTLC